MLRKELQNILRRNITLASGVVMSLEKYLSASTVIEKIKSVQEPRLGYRNLLKYIVKKEDLEYACTKYLLECKNTTIYKLKVLYQDVEQTIIIPELLYHEINEC